MGLSAAVVSAVIKVRCRWFRRRYFVQGSDILPVLRSESVEYDPFTQSDKEPLVNALVELDTGSSRAVEDFASNWGLLGLFFDPLSAISIGDGPVQLVAEPPGLHLQSYPELWPGQHAIARVGSGAGAELDLEAYSRPYFLDPDRPLTAAISCPAWLDCMSEPLDQFSEAVRDFRQTFKECIEWREHRRPGDVPDLLEAVRTHLQHVLPAHDGVSLPLFCPSLLSAAYLMLLPYLSDNPNVRLCARKSCGRPFVTDRADRIFCSKRCQNAENQREYRRNLKERQPKR